MKLLHTSDWHLGQQFFDYDRLEEQCDMLRQITAIVAEEHPDALLVSGDVFHTGNPSPRAVKLYNRALLEMHEACPTMQIVITAGNHDSASRLVVDNDLWQHFRVTVVGHVARQATDRRLPDFDSHIIEVEGKGFIAAVPHCYESNFPSPTPELQRADRARAFFQGLLDRVAERNTNGLPVALMAHTAITGCDTAGHDCIGGMETREPAVFGHGYDYVALGHIHSPQSISPRIRYSGTPIPVNFGEKFDHSVSIVTLAPGALPEVATRSISNLIPLEDFPTPLPPADAVEEKLPADARPLPFSEVLERLKALPTDRRCYLRLIVKVDQTLTPLASTLVAEAVKGKECRVCRIQAFEFKKKKEQRKAAALTMTAEDLLTKTPLEIAERFFQMKDITFTPRQREMVEEATRTAERNLKGEPATPDHDEA